MLLNEFISSIGFKIDTKALDLLSKRLSQLDVQLNGIAKRMNKVAGVEMALDNKVTRTKLANAKKLKKVKDTSKVFVPKAPIRDKILGMNLANLQGPMINRSKSSIRKAQRDSAKMQAMETRNALSALFGAYGYKSRSGRPSDLMGPNRSTLMSLKDKEWMRQQKALSALFGYSARMNEPMRRPPQPSQQPPANNIASNIARLFLGDRFYRSFQPGRLPLGTALGYGTGALGAGALATQITTRSETIEGSRLAIDALASEAGSEKFARMNQIADNLALSLGQLAQPMASLQAAVAGTDLENSVIDMSEGFFEYGRVTMRTQEQLSLGLRALGQMAQKGQVYAEEFRSQLQEHIPVSVLKIANKLGYETAAEFGDAMKNGLIKSDDFIPAYFALLKEEAAKGLESIKKTSQFQRDLLNRNLERLSYAFYKGGFDRVLSRVFELVNVFVERLEPAMAMFGHWLEVVTHNTEHVIRLIRFLVDSFSNLDYRIQIILAAVALMATRFGRLGVALYYAADYLDTFILTLEALIENPKKFILSFLEEIKAAMGGDSGSQMGLLTTLTAVTVGLLAFTQVIKGLGWILKQYGFIKTFGGKVAGTITPVLTAAKNIATSSAGRQLTSTAGRGMPYLGAAMAAGAGAYNAFDYLSSAGRAFTGNMTQSDMDRAFYGKLPPIQINVTPPPDMDVTNYVIREVERKRNELDGIWKNPASHYSKM